MNPITHLLVGWTTLEQAQRADRDRALVVLAGLAPDLDGLGVVIKFFARLLGFDLFNTFGIQILWPLTPRRYCLDAVFFIDTVAWMLTLGYLAMALDGVVPQGAGAIGYAMLFAAYALAKLVLQRHVRSKLGVDFAIPSAFNPFGFYLFTRRDGQLYTARFNAVSGRTSHAETQPEATADIARLSVQSGVFRDMQSILRGLQITRAEADRSGTRIVAQDLAVRNFGGKFGRTELRFDAEGRLVHEMAHI